MTSRLIPANHKLPEFPKNGNRNLLLNYNKEYDSTIGLKGKWYITEIPKGIDVLWNGKNFLNKNSGTPFLGIPETFTKHIPVGISLTGILSFTNGINRDWKYASFIAFDCPMPQQIFEIRLQKIRKIKILPASSSYFKVASYIELQEIRSEFGKVNDISKSGKDVLMINSKHIIGSKTTEGIIEYKKESTMSAVIVGLYEGMGKYYTQLGKYKCALKTARHKTFFCSGGLSDELRKKYQFDRTVCYGIENGAPKIGDTINVAFIKLLDSGIPKECRLS